MIISLTFSCTEFCQILFKIARRHSSFERSTLWTSNLVPPVMYAEFDLYVEVIRKDVQVSNAI